MEHLSIIKLITQASEEQWEELDLSGMNLSELPSEIGDLLHLGDSQELVYRCR
jgi:hypothetical protein